jgi:hypothetical protein
VGRSDFGWREQRDLGCEVVRWIWANLFAPDQLLDRLARAFAGSRRV